MPEHQQVQKSQKSNTTFQKQATFRGSTQISTPSSIIQRARINSKSLTTADVLQLQRTIGNRVVGRLLSEIRNPSKVQQAPIQRQETPEEEEPLQGKMIETVQRQEITEEEESLQGKFENKPERATCPSCMQRQESPEEEEPLQGKFETIQRLKPEEEEKLQMKSVVQRQDISEEEEPLQGKMAEPIQRQEIPEEDAPIQGKMIGTIQRQEIPEEEPLQKKSENNTGMSNNLKAGVENLSGIDMSDVRVHYNSSKPAEVGALAYTQGTNIHVAPGQEKHLPHEAWHVVQQMQGRVKPTLQLKNLAINDDAGLEWESKVMGGEIRNMIEIGSNKISALDREETSSLSGTGVVQLVHDAEKVFDSNAFKDPVTFLRKRRQKGKILEEIGSSGITGVAQQSLVVNLGVRPKLREDIYTDLEKADKKNLAQELKSTVFGITSAERWVRLHSLELDSIPVIRTKYLLKVQGNSLDVGQPDQTFHYDSGKEQITKEELSNVGCHDPNDQELAISEANGPSGAGFVKGHLTEFDRKDHMYCDHVHVNKNTAPKIDIYESEPEFNKAVGHKPLAKLKEDRRTAIRLFLKNASKSVGENYRERDAELFIQSQKGVWEDDVVSN